MNAAGRASWQRAMGRRLRQAREKRGLSLAGAEAASEGLFTAVAHATWERGDRLPDVFRIAEVAAFWGIPVGELMPVVDGPVPEPPPPEALDLVSEALGMLGEDRKLLAGSVAGGARHGSTRTAADDITKEGVAT